MRKDKKVKCKRQVQWHIVVRQYCGTLQQQHLVLLCKHCVVQALRCATAAALVLAKADTT